MYIKQKAEAKRLGLLMGTSLKDGGAKGIRTPDPHVANVMLYQLSYRPKRKWP